MDKLVVLKCFAFFVLLSSPALSCSTNPYSFCETMTHKPNDIVIMGKIAEVIQNGIRIEVINVFKGIENRTNIIIWDGSDFECMGESYSMAASEMGQLNDTIVAILPLISIEENNWDVLDDYRRPDFFEYTTMLKINTDTVYGFISGNSYAPTNHKLLKEGYQQFSDRWNNGSMNCFINGIDTRVNTINLFPNPATSVIILRSEGDDGYFNIAILEMNGKKIKEFNTFNSQININDIPKGEYIFFINDRNMNTITKKVLIE